MFAKPAIILIWNCWCMTKDQKNDRLERERERERERDNKDEGDKIQLTQGTVCIDIVWGKYFRGTGRGTSW